MTFSGCGSKWEFFLFFFFVRAIQRLNMESIFLYLFFKITKDLPLERVLRQSHHLKHWSCGHRPARKENLWSFKKVLPAPNIFNNQSLLVGFFLLIWEEFFTTLKYVIYIHEWVQKVGIFGLWCIFNANCSESLYAHNLNSHLPSSP